MTYHYHSISLQGYANASTQEGYQSPPLGRVELGGVWFDLPTGRNSITTQAEPLPGYPTRLLFPDLRIHLPQSVHLLLTGGNTRRSCLGDAVGLVALVFDNGQSIQVQVIPGWNLREWKIYGEQDVTWTEDANTQQVWSGGNRHDSGLGVIDMVTIAIPEYLARRVLTTIEIADHSAETAGSLDPAINVIGITVLDE